MSGLQIALAVLATLFVWWFSTGLVLYLVGLPRRTYRWSLLGATVVLGVAIWGLFVSASDATTGGAYIAFGCTVLVWGWQEICFLTGVATGPRTDPCPSGLAGWKRVGAAVQVILYHEVQLLALGVAVALATIGGSNQVGLWTYVVLWTMRLSAKLNLFLGVPYLHDNWLPAQLHFLRSYFRIRPMNGLFPLTVSAATIVTFVLVEGAFAPEVGAFEAAGQLLLASLLALAVLEHWFMVLPLPIDTLWAGFRARQASRRAVQTVANARLNEDPESTVPPAVGHVLVAKPMSSPARVTNSALVFPASTVNGR